MVSFPPGIPEALFIAQGTRHRRKRGKGYGKAIRPNDHGDHAGGLGKTELLAFLARRGLSLGGLGLRHALLEFIYATCRIHKFLLAGVEGVARVAYAHNDNRLRGSGLDHVATRATDFRFHILRMNVCFHKRPQKIAFPRQMTSTKKESAAL
jgi:hypothetical protein